MPIGSPSAFFGCATKKRQRNSRDCGTIIGQLSTEDPDNDDTHTYVVVGGEVGKFDIADERLIVRSGAPLDYEAVQSLPVIVCSADQAGASIESILEIKFSDVAEDVLGTVTDDKINARKTPVDLLLEKIPVKSLSIAERDIRRTIRRKYQKT